MSKADDENVGVSIGWSWSGVNAKIKSRFLSAVDRFGGRRIDEGGLDSERRIASHKAMTEARVTLITAATRTLSKEIENDPEFARRALQVFSRAERQAENVEACLSLALEDLKNRELPPPENDAGPEVLDTAILDRWEHYAGGATSEQLRERWGRVLSAEVRVPGTFNSKCLRIVDELSSEDAKLFERLCERRLVAWVPTCTTSISDHDVDRLVEAGLVIQSDMGRTLPFVEGSAEGKKAWYLHAGEGLALALRGDAKLPMKGLVDLLLSDKGTPCLPVHVLTDGGVALSSILPHNPTSALSTLAKTIQAKSEADSVWIYKRVDERRWQRLQTEFDE